MLLFWFPIRLLTRIRLHKNGLCLLKFSSLSLVLALARPFLSANWLFGVIFNYKNVGAITQHVHVRSTECVRRDEKKNEQLFEWFERTPLVQTRLVARAPARTNRWKKKSQRVVSAAIHQDIIPHEIVADAHNKRLAICFGGRRDKW